jgi:hypothetical protein
MGFGSSLTDRTILAVLDHFQRDLFDLIFDGVYSTIGEQLSNLA